MSGKKRAARTPVSDAELDAIVTHPALAAAMADRLATTIRDLRTELAAQTARNTAMVIRANRQRDRILDPAATVTEGPMISRLKAAHHIDKITSPTPPSGAALTAEPAQQPRAS